MAAAGHMEEEEVVDKQCPSRSDLHWPRALCLARAHPQHAGASRQCEGGYIPGSRRAPHCCWRLKTEGGLEAGPGPRDVQLVI